ncbi:MAG: carbohydrate kinase family protein [Ectothiorhodospiraceae bacterium AqS1]|nr:carbohydrate kinase family protein [Ectothiorhodospiraceae bacterium AqS1]
MSALICGSFAYDTVMSFPDRFKNRILPDHLDILSVTFRVSDFRRDFGGCAGNVSYTLKGLGGDPLPMATVGKDFETYRDWLAGLGIEDRLITPIEDEYTAQAFITTDLDNNHIAAFYPGAMNYAHRNDVRDIDQCGAGLRKASIAIISPDGVEGMIRHAEQCAECGIPFIFDPGQSLPMFDAQSLRRFVDLATWLSCNNYEWEFLRERTGLDAASIASRLKALIVTCGEKGSTIRTQDEVIDIPCAMTKTVVNTIGCGDAYRAGLLHGISNGMDWRTTGRLASMAAAISVEYPGSQNHGSALADIEERFRSSFGYAL